MLYIDVNALNSSLNLKLIKTVISSISIFMLTKNKKMRAGKLAQQIRVLATKPDDLPSVSGIDELE